MPLGDDLSKLILKRDIWDEPTAEQKAKALRLELNKMQRQVSQLSALVDSKGNLDANIFSHKSGQFSVLPHQAASMYRTINETAQTIANETLTAITFHDDSLLADSEKRLSYSHGIKRATATGEFFLEGVPNETLFLFNAAVFFTAAPSSWFYMQVMEKDTSTGMDLDTRVANELVGVGSIVLQARKAAGSWQLHVWQSSGATRDIDVAYFQVTRIR